MNLPRAAAAHDPLGGVTFGAALELPELVAAGRQTGGPRRSNSSGSAAGGGPPDLQHLERMNAVLQDEVDTLRMRLQALERTFTQKLASVQQAANAAAAEQLQRQEQQQAQLAAAQQKAEALEAQVAGLQEAQRDVAGRCGQLEEATGGLQQGLQQLQQQVGRQAAACSSQAANEAARERNRRARGGDPLVPLRDSTGRVPEGFPASAMQVLELEGAQLDALLAALELEVEVDRGCVGAKRLALLEAVGLR